MHLTQHEVTQLQLIDPGAFQFRILAEVAIAMILGALIGLDRELANKPAGLRTHILVTGSAALFVALGSTMVQSFTGQLDSQLIRSDPIRIIEAVVTGISFLGAGTIFRYGDDKVEGLTTAASILFAAGVGVAVALAQIMLAIALTLLVLLVLRGLYHIDRWLEPYKREVETREVQ